MQFIGDDFLLSTKTARTLYHSFAEGMPIFDYHSHLSAKQIYEDCVYDNISEAWFSDDHYKWRLMRSDGIPEEFITGNADAYSKFVRYAKAVQDAPGNPLYHWTHLELLRYFGISECLTVDSAKEIFDRCNVLLRERTYSVRRLLEKQNVDTVFTTNDPSEDLKYHELLAKTSDCAVHVYPAFRPDNVLNINKENFDGYIGLLGATERTQIKDIDSLLFVLEKRLIYFRSRGCSASDHSLEGNFRQAATKEEAGSLLLKRLSGNFLSETETAKYKGYLLENLARLYGKYSIIMQLHIGAARNVSSGRFALMGANAGCDSMDDITCAGQLGALLDAADQGGNLPKTIIYCLNPKDAPMIASLCGNFQNSTVRGNIQPGAAWWFNDTKSGIEKQLSLFAQYGALAACIGMTTDSRSFLSYPRHEYFRRILCSLLGTWVENGEYPADITCLGKMVQDISFTNAKEFFRCAD
jgi:glucuronate isomerase